MKYQLGQYIETNYGRQIFRGHITSISGGQYLVTPDEGTILPHSQFSNHGNHICNDNKIKVISQHHFNDELFTL
jgi:hypothetical protein